TPASGTPGGTVTFVEGATPLATATLSGGVATFTSSTLSVGSHVVQATYAGDASFTGSSGTTSQSVDTTSTTTTLISSSASTTYGDSVTFTATVAGPGGTPSGTIVFFVDGANAGSVDLDASGTATLTTAALGAGTRTISATYGGDQSYSTSDATPIAQSIARRTSTTSLVSSKNPGTYAQSVTFTATVA